MRVWTLTGFLLIGGWLAAQEEGDWRTAFGRNLQESVRAGDASPLVQAWDVTSFANRVAAALPAKTQAASHKGIVVGLGTGGFLKDAVAEWSSGRFAFLNRTAKGGLICRSYTDEGGLNYIEFDMEGTAEEPRLVDFFIFSSGERFSQTQVQLFKSMARGETDLKELEGLDRVTALTRSGNPDQALAAYRAMPDALQKTKLGYQAGLKAALQADVDSYNKMLADYVAAFPEDPSVALLSIDVYFAQKQWAKCHEVLDGLEKRVKNDSAIELVRGNVLSVEGKKEQAGRAYVRAIKLDPGFEEPHWSLLTTLLEIKKFDGAVRILALLESRFDYNFSPGGLAENDLYTEFLASPEGKAWSDTSRPQVIDSSDSPQAP